MNQDRAAELLNQALALVLEAELNLIHGCTARTHWEIQQQLGKNVRSCVEACEQAENMLASARSYIVGEEI